MTQRFSYEINPGRILFGAGTLDAIAAFDALGADCLVALGGGSTIGLGKAIALRNDAPQIVVATTYAGSEVTPVVGQTENDVRTTVRDPKVLPEVVIYDPALTLELPVAMSVTSGLNAIAHAMEGMYARDRNPVSSLMAVEGVRALRDALRAIVKEPGDLATRSDALYGSQAAAAELQPLADLFGGSIGGGLYDFAQSLGAPLALRDLGVDEAQLDRAADLAVKNPYWNPRPVERDAVRELVQRAWQGTRPE